MAERLAPERTPRPITSVPEPSPGGSLRWLRRLVVASVVLVPVGLLALVTMHFLVIQGPARDVRATSLIPEGLPVSVLVVVARPGQELPMAGTLAALDAAGARVSLLALTRAEGQPPLLALAADEAAAAAADRLARIRAEEFARSGELLGVESTNTVAFADGSLRRADPAEVTAAISRSISHAKPSILLTVGDPTGADPDAQAVGTYVVAAARVAGSGVERVWTVTRGGREVSWTNLVSGDVLDPAALPAPDVAIDVAAHWFRRGEALRAHGSQSPDLAAGTYPHADRLSSWAYFRFFDREYFHLAWGQPLP